MSTYIIVASMSTHMSSRIAGHVVRKCNRVWGVMQVRHTNNDGYEVLTAATCITATKNQLEVLLHHVCCHLLQSALTLLSQLLTCYRNYFGTWGKERDRNKEREIKI